MAADSGDFITVVYQMARMMRRIMIFDSMQRETLLRDIHRVNAYLNYFASLDQDSSDGRSPNGVRLSQEQLQTLSRQVGFNYTNPNDWVTMSISIFTGFLDGSFRAVNTSACRLYLQL